MAPATAPAQAAKPAASAIRLFCNCKPAPRPLRASAHVARIPVTSGISGTSGRYATTFRMTRLGGGIVEESSVGVSGDRSETNEQRPPPRRVGSSLHDLSPPERGIVNASSSALHKNPPGA